MHDDVEGDNYILNCEYHFGDNVNNDESQTEDEEEEEVSSSSSSSDITLDSSSEETEFYTLQNGEGPSNQNIPEVSPDFIVEGESSCMYRRFGMEGIEIRGRLPNPPDGVNIFEWLEGCMNRLHARLTAGRDPSDFIGVTIESDYFSQGVLWLSFRPIQNFDVDDLWYMLFSAVQSANDFHIDDSLTIKCGIVSDVRGQGRMRLTEECVNKRSILKIRNDDNLCLPRSLVTATAHSVRGQIRSGDLHEYWNRVRQWNSSLQKKESLNLVNLAQVTIPINGCGIQEIHQFQNFLANHGIAIVVYSFQSFGTGALPLYDGTRFVIEIYKSVLRTLRIMYYENSRHYQPILNLVAATGSRGYCIPCNKSYKCVEDHRCSNRCYKCLKSPVCDNNQNQKKCDRCFRCFFGDVCFQNHLTPGSFNKTRVSVCDAIKICQMCYKTVRSVKHECGKSYCDVCNENLPIGHFCYIQPIQHKTVNSVVLYLFYDFETQQSISVLGDDDRKIHIPNLCVVQQVCTFCIDDKNIFNNCERCGMREYVFKQDPVKQLVELAMERKKVFKKTICIAHNSQGFDAQFIFKYLVENHRGHVKPSVIMNGTKIIMMGYLNVKFIDSLNYFHMPLSNLPKSYGLSEIEKGAFPHLFNTPENQDYVGPLPPIEMYAIDSMSSIDRSKFLKWYNEQTEAECVFNFQEEIVKYCKQDVNILRQACINFRLNFMKFNVDPFDECVTIASSCLRVFRKNFLKKNQLGIVPVRGYRMIDNQSGKAIQWLYWMEQVLGRTIAHASRGREKTLIEGIRVDGYCEPQVNENHKGIVLQFHGCFWHGCPRCFRINRDEVLSHGESMDDKYEKTCTISEKIKSSKYQLIEMWECAFNREISQNIELNTFIERNVKIFNEKPLDPRDAFFGGRTGNTVKMYECKDNEKIKYVDVCSLYPYICKTGKYPIGHPQLYIGNDCHEFLGDDLDITKVNGLIMCEILPPRNLHHPVLPVRMHNKLIFPLCYTCCKFMIQEDCPHDDPVDRILYGTWVSEEVKRAVELGYKIIAVHEIWQYEMTQYDPKSRSGGVFTGYIDEFFKQKTEASGFPSECVTDEDKERYIHEFEKTEGIKLNKDNIVFNAGLRSVAKLCLNSLWGKLGQKENMPRTEVVTEAKRLNDLLNSPEIEVTGVLPVNDETLYVGWRYRDDAYISSPTSSVVTAAFTTAQARLKLFEYLNILGSRVLYYDTDSVFYVSRDGENDLPVGSMLGELTDELSGYGVGTFISSFISGGPKFYAYKFKTSEGEKCECKVKGIRLNFSNSQKINFDSVRNLVIGSVDEITLSSSAIRRTAFHEVVTLKEKKTCKTVYGKRRFVGLSSSYPYGYKVEEEEMERR